VRVLTLVLSVVALAVLVTVLVKFRSKPIREARVPGEDWRPTEETVHDPATGRTLRIWVDPSDGTRYSVAELR
jgi:hypothetical protein